MTQILHTFLFTSTLILFSCGTTSKKIDFDSTKWKSDPKGCSDVRQSLVPRLKEIKPQLIGLDELTILNLLGSPEKEQLSSRGTKTFYYYIDGGREFCNKDSIPWILSIDFGALNNVRMITFQRF